MAKNIAIVGAHGRTGLRLTHLLARTHNVKGIVRIAEHKDDMKYLKAEPVVLSLESSPVAEFTRVFEGLDVVYFTAAASAWGDLDLFEKIDYKGAVKVFDAIEGVKGPKPRLILISGLDVRDPSKIPPHYTLEDIQMSKYTQRAMGAYIHWKYEADKNLSKRTAFKWTVLRPGVLSNAPGSGKVTVGKAHLGNMMPRDDLARALAYLLDKEDAAGLVLDIIAGGTPYDKALDAAIKKGETDFIG